MVERGSAHCRGVVLTVLRQIDESHWLGHCSSNRKESLHPLHQILEPRTPSSVTIRLGVARLDDRATAHHTLQLDRRFHRNQVDPIAPFAQPVHN